MKFLLTLVTAVALLSPLPVYADPFIYQCQVISDAFIKADGSLDVLQDSPRIGQKFTVMKKTGDVVGDVMDSLKNPKVLSSGSDKNSYKVLWEQKSSSKSRAYVDYLNIDEFAKGMQKPFGFFSGSLLLTGICE
ncbi:hypothetical protein ICN48_12100 [Polynucleobacter sp. JS-Safj-400b-B2]|uniref:hypothetical protein n=1 Tax=Polynucleobacter sp. JS-Safj-400b-B2 TaxID=2576921 RepID=UPI001C0D49AC|nr:hypothetical protein [Polynucleobacter sp. JS-Safj-400b-B2]MBU3626971.1 hypothetical protein [Polynucleobacter sp. JS-Safj-400b-B2]